MPRSYVESLSHFGFFLLPGFSMIAFSNAIEPLRAANLRSGLHLYRWSLLSVDGGFVAASNSLSLKTSTLDSTDVPDIVFVCGGTAIQRTTPLNALPFLRKLATTRCVLGSLCTGTHALVKAGLLDGYACTIHWAYLSALKEQHPSVRFLNDLFVIDRDRVTCSGGIAPVRMMLNLIQTRAGAAVARAISEQFILYETQVATEQQQIPYDASYSSAHQPLVKAIRLMEANIEEPLSVADLARSMSMSSRQLQRVFKQCVSMTPACYYLTLRLRRARELLSQTNMPVMQITLACGFRSSSHFCSSYRDLFGLPPVSERRKSRLSSTSPTGFIR
jgi:transcriptional regulator GlxA family with amidase domain